MRSIPTTFQVRTLDTLTAFRFFAVLFVFLAHLDYESYPLLSYSYQRYFYNTAGVAFFFVLSGFILTYNYRAKISSFDWDEIKKFYVARIARLYPVHILTFFLSIFVVYTTFPTDLIGELMKALTNVTLTQSLYPGVAYPLAFNAPAWSISDQLFFSLVLPVLLAILVKVKGISVGRSLALCIGIWVADLAIVFLLRDIPSLWLLYIFPLIRLFDFCLGAVICFLFLGIKETRLPSWFFTLLEFLAIGGFFVALYFFPYIPTPFTQAVYYLPFAGMIIFVFAFQRGRLSKILANRSFVRLGQISFAFFMFHWLVLRYIATRHLFDITDHPFFAAGIGFGISLAIAYACFRFYESPLRRRIVGFVKTRGQ